MANYLRASGAPRDWRRALFAYNHAGWYVDEVLAQAADYRRQRGAGAADTPTSRSRLAAAGGSLRCPAFPVSAATRGSSATS